MKPNHDKLMKSVAVDDLRRYDHGFLSVEGAERISAPFGFKAHTRIERADPDDPKGLTFLDGATEKAGVAAHDLAKQICRHVGVEYLEMHGRGSQLRACCDALEQWLKLAEGES